MTAMPLPSSKIEQITLCVRLNFEMMMVRDYVARRMLATARIETAALTTTRVFGEPGGVLRTKRFEYEIVTLEQHNLNTIFETFLKFRFLNVVCRRCAAFKSWNDSNFEIYDILIVNN